MPDGDKIVKKEPDKPYSFVDEFKKYVSKGSPYVNDVREVSQTLGVNPNMLMASSYVEGYNGYVAGTFGKSPFYSKSLNRNQQQKYSFDGFAFGGLDMVGERLDRLKQKGYIPKDFDVKTFTAINEKGQRVQAGAFISPKDALIMKAAILKDGMDDINAYTKQKNIQIKPEHMDYFAMAAYNGGIGNAREMIDEYAAAQDKEKFISEGLTKKKGIHRNLAQRTELFASAAELFSN